MVKKCKTLGARILLLEMKNGTITLEKPKLWKSGKKRKYIVSHFIKNEMQMAYKQEGNFSVPALRKEMKSKISGRS